MNLDIVGIERSTIGIQVDLRLHMRGDRGRIRSDGRVGELIRQLEPRPAIGRLDGVDRPVKGVRVAGECLQGLRGVVENDHGRIRPPAHGIDQLIGQPLGFDQPGMPGGVAVGGGHGGGVVDEDDGGLAGPRGNA